MASFRTLLRPLNRLSIRPAVQRRSISLYNSDIAGLTDEEAEVGLLDGGF